MRARPLPFPPPSLPAPCVCCSAALVVTDPPEWVPDEACGFCTSCKAPFTVIRRKHHCRSCGKVGGAPLALCIFGVYGDCPQVQHQGLEVRADVPELSCVFVVLLSGF